MNNQRNPAAAQIVGHSATSVEGEKGSGAKKVDWVNWS